MIAKSKAFILCCLFLCGTTHVSAQHGGASENTVNILIDVSGSMQQNDPDNQRISAVKLLINLLPDGTRSGIWMFAENTTALSKTTAVDKDWKKRALVSVNKIHSRGLFTHIENAIHTALKDGFGQKTEKNLILLTDGMVDISEDIMQSGESRERIISELIPILQREQIKVQAIALSAHADKELLEKLAFTTGGWFEIAQSAGQLQKTFLKMFNQAIPQDRAPLHDNIFSIDDSVKEFSVLVFRKAGASETRLINPAGNKLRRQDRPPNLTWIQEQHYDLITVQQPEVGEWKIEAAIDPDNQVMLMTDLKFHVNDLPSHIAEREAIEVMAHFTEQGEVIVRDDFLQLLQVSLLQTDALNRKSEWQMQILPGTPGYFGQTLAETLEKGRHAVKIVADGKTFQRELVRTIEVVESALKVNKSFDSEQQTISVELVPDAAIIDPSKLTAQAIIHVADKPVEMIDLQAEQERLLLTLAIPAQDEKMIVNFEVMAKTVRGAPVTPSIKPIIIDAQFIQALAGQEKPTASAEDQSKQSAELVSSAAQQQADNVNGSEEKMEDKEHTTAEHKAGESENARQEEGSWGLVIGAVAVINLLLFGCGFWSYKLLTKRATEKQEKLLDRLT